MPAVAMPKDDWTPDKLKSHRDWRTKMYSQPKPKIDPLAEKIVAVAAEPMRSELELKIEELERRIEAMHSERVMHVAAAQEPLGPVPRATIEEILGIVAKFYGYSPLQFKSAAKPSALAKARMVAMYVCKECTLRSLKEIGRHFGGRDHSTVCHAHDKTKRRMRENKEFCQEVASLEALFT